MDILFLIILSWQLHRMSVAKRVSPWPYVLNFVAIFSLSSFLLVFFLYRFMGFTGNIQEWGNTLKPYTSFILLFEFMLFIFFRQKIVRLPDYHDGEDDSNLSASGGKKDLSYFR